jgi:hypothetical protein
MKTLFRLMLLIAIGSGLWQIFLLLQVSAHNQSRVRYEALTNPNDSREQTSGNYGLTMKELSVCDEHFGNAYRVAVFDGYRLSKGFESLFMLGLGISTALLVASIAGLLILRKNPKDAAPRVI